MKKIYRLMIVAALSATASGAMAEAPSNYYVSLNGKSDAELKTAVSKACVYNPTGQITAIYSNLPSSFRVTDVYPGSDYWWDMYSPIKTNINLSFGTATNKGGGGMNREHSFPKSWWGGIDTTPAWCDLNHLYPAKGEPNVEKSNWPLAEVQTAVYDNGVTKVGYAKTGLGGGASKVFEPADEYKGDFARAYFYMVTRYQDLTWSTKYMWMMDQTTYPTLKQWAIDMLLRWAKNDPVSQKEINRNEAVYFIQKNRNPFIDYPELAEYIWGDKRGQKFYINEDINGDPELTTPARGMALDFSQVAEGGKVARELGINGRNLTGSITLTISGTDKAMFTIPSRSLSASLVNAADGYYLPITYKPTAVGEHTAKLTISDGGLAGSRTVTLIGQCLPVPDLTPIEAMPATDITDTSYTANWVEPVEVVDYYIITRTRYNNGKSSSVDVIAEDGSSYEFLDFEGDESYNVRSCRLGYESPRSNEIYVDHAGITDVAEDIPVGWANYPGGVRIVCAAPLADVAVYDLTGRLVRVVPEVANNDIIELPMGAYMIVSGNTVLRVLVSAY